MGEGADSDGSLSRMSVDLRWATATQVGNNNVQQNFYAARPEVAYPHRVGLLPAAADGYQARPLGADGGQRDLAPVTVLTGLAGVGKTQMAAAYARGAWAEGRVDLLVWVSAGSREAVLAAYAQAASDVAQGQPGESVEQIVGRFLTWLGTTDKRWIVVLDDLADPRALAGLWPPVTPAGHVVVTTQRAESSLQSADRRLLPVPVFTVEEASAFLARRLPPDAMGGAAELAEDLGYLPLALAQAASYIVDRDLDCEQYRDRLAGRRLELALPADARADDYEGVVAGTWSLAIERADEMHPRGLASRALALASVLDAQGIPVSLLTAPAARAYLTDQPLLDADAVDALHNLRRLSLLSWSPAGPHGLRVVRVHGLVQRAVRERLSAVELAQAVEAAAESLAEAWPDVAQDPELELRLRANAEAAASREPQLRARPAVVFALWLATVSLGNMGLVVDAARRSQDLFEEMSELGLEPDDLLVLRGTAIRWRGESGDVEGARRAAEAAVSEGCELYGEDDPRLLGLRLSLVRWIGESGDVPGASTASEALAEDLEHVLGPDDELTLIARGHVLRWRLEGGDLAAAMSVYDDLVQGHRRVFGADSVKTLEARLAEAGILGRGGDATGAVRAATDVLDDVLRIAGPDHPVTLHARATVAFWLGEAGDAAAALSSAERLCADQERLLGPDSPSTLATRDQVARWRGYAGDPLAAVRAFEQLVQDDLRVLGPDHPQSLMARHNLAFWLGRAGDPLSAVAAYERLLPEQVRVLGSDHPETLRTRSNMASSRWAAGQPVAAVALQLSLVLDATRALGPHHPDVRSAGRWLERYRLDRVRQLRRQAHERSRAADSEGAARLLAEARETVHALPTTSGTYGELTSVLRELYGQLMALGRRDEAVAALLELCRLHDRFGALDEEVVSDLQHLAELLRRVGRADSAQQAEREARSTELLLVRRR